MIFWPTGNRRFGGSGRPRAGGIPSKKVRDEAPHLFGRFPGRPGPLRPPKSTISGRKPRCKLHLSRAAALELAEQESSSSECFGQAARDSASATRHTEARCISGRLRSVLGAHIDARAESRGHLVQVACLLSRKPSLPGPRQLVRTDRWCDLVFST